METGLESNQIQFRDAGTIAVLRVSPLQRSLVCRQLHLEGQCEVAVLFRT
jgi:hypothetical protein